MATWPTARTQPARPPGGEGRPVPRRPDGPLPETFRPAATAPVGSAWDTALAEVRLEQQRADGKAATLLGLASLLAAVAVPALAAARPQSLVVAAAVTGLALLAGSVVLLALTVRPALAIGGARHGFVAWADCDRTTGPDPADLPGAPADATRLVDLSRLTRTKYRRVRTATDLLTGALLLFVLAAALTPLT